MVKKVNVNDFLGVKFNKLTVVESLGVNDKHESICRCKCECGNEKVYAFTKVKNGFVQSCGCLTVEKTKEKNSKHGKRHTSLYNIWRGMKVRCNNENATGYSNYGGRGITVCNDWMEFTNFYDWAMQSGYVDGLTIERKDVDKGYNPENCTWLSKPEQSKNRRSNKYVTLFGETKILDEWLKDSRINMSRNTYNARIRRGLSTETALTTPIERRGRV